ncbi:MAG: zinc ribbon domain-containing protein [Actinomycetota bacterium]
MIGVGMGAFLLVLAVAYLVGRPFLLPAADDAVAAQAREDRDRVVAQLRDLDMEFATAKLAEDEYRTQRASRIAELDAADAVIAEVELPLDELEQPLDDEPNETAPESLDAAIEERIAARRRAMSRADCPQCGDEIQAGDRFCRSCGASLGGDEVNR